jgi:hypothetical protein
MLISIIVDVLQFNKNSMKNLRSLVTVFASLGLLTLTSCNDNQVPKVTTIVTSSGQTVEVNKLQFTTYQGKQWLVATPNINKSPKVFGEFNDGTIIPNWYKLRSSTSDNPEDLLKVQFNIVDLLMGRNEGNFIYDEDTSKWYMSLDIVHSKDPGFTRSQNGVGLANAGPASVNCFADRPEDQKLRPICATLFKQTGSSLSEFSKLDSAGRTDQFYKMKAGIYLGNLYQSVLRKNSQSIISILNSTGMGNLSTSLKLVYIDQSNQLGLGGATRLARLDKSYWSLTKADILKRIKGIGVGDSDGIFVTGQGQSINLNNIPLAMLRVAYARVQWHNGHGDLTNFSSGDRWLERAAKRWSFASLLKDSPKLKDEIKASIVSKSGEQDWSEVQFKATPDNLTPSKVNIEVSKGDTILFTAQHDLGSGRNYQAVDVAFGDILRRIASLPQSQQEFNEMKQSSQEFLDKEYYQAFGLKK